MKLPVPQLPIFLGNARRRRRPRQPESAPQPDRGRAADPHFLDKLIGDERPSSSHAPGQQGKDPK